MQNKNIIIIFLLSALMGIGKSAAQTILLDPAEWYIGVSGNTTASMYNFRPRITQSYQMGYGGGLALRYITENHRGLQIEINYGQRGWKEANHDYARLLNYIEVPFLTHLYLGNRNRFIFNLGPKFSYFLGDKILQQNIVENSEEPQHTAPILYKYDYGIVAGFGYNLNFRNAGVYQFELRGYYGLADIFSNDRSEYFQNSNPLTLSVNLGYFIPITGRENNRIIKQEEKEQREKLKIEKQQNRESAKVEKELKKAEEKKNRENKKTSKNVKDDSPEPNNSAPETTEESKQTEETQENL